MSRTRAGFTTALIGAACAGALLLAASPAMAGDSGAANRSPVGHWQTSTNGVKQDITFTKDGKAYGSAGCNRFTGGYSTNGSAITIGPLASTLMACEPVKMKAEAKFLGKLDAAESYTATTTVLRISSTKGELVFHRIK